MFVSILKKVRRQLVLLFAVSLVIVAAYVSAGRQFMPAVSRYVSFFEQQIFEITGAPVSIGSLSGGFQGFNPVLQINDLSLLVDDSKGSALVFDSATLIVDMPGSLLRRQWVLQDFVVEKLELNFEQSPDGSWQLRGVNSSGDASVDIDKLYSSLLQLSQLSLSNVSINFQALNEEVISFVNGSASIQNRDDRHFLHVNASLSESNQALELSFEVAGSQLSEIDGQLHLQLPKADYTPLFSGLDIGEMNISRLIGGGDFWIDFSAGELSDFVTDLDVDIVTLLAAGRDPVSLENISGNTRLSKNFEEDEIQLTLSQMSVAWQEMSWSPFNAYAVLRPQRSLSVRADLVDVSLISRFIAGSGLLDTVAQRQLEMYAPEGFLKNLTLDIPLEEAGTGHFRVKSNVQGMEIASVQGSPNMSGINGYVELDFDPVSRIATGLAEVESENFRIGIPSVFTSTWDYKYVNGSLGFHLDLSAGQLIKMVSSVIVAESDAVNARVQFSSTINRPDEGERKAELELLVGALELDAAEKSLYLPDGPGIDDNLRDTMEWLDRAILGGSLHNSGALFRGSTLPGSGEASKTFQSFYLLEQGEIDFGEEWPNLAEVSAVVSTDDINIDIDVETASSMSIGASSVFGEIRQNQQGETWLTLHGQASGNTADGLDYLQGAPVAQELKNAFENWQAQGGFSSDIEVIIPLSPGESDTEVRLDIALDENRLVIPDYGLVVEELSGAVIFDSRTGIENSALRGRLFEQLVNLNLSSSTVNGELETIFVEGTGTVAPEKLIDWSLQSEFVKDLLRKMEGQLAYSSKLSINQNTESDVRNTLLIESSLIGASLSLPDPFTKPVELELPLRLEIDFSDSRQHIQGALGEKLGFALELEAGFIEDGLVYIGQSQSNFANLMDSQSSGLVVLGSLDRFQLEPWSELLEEFNAAGNASSDFSSTLQFIDLELDTLELYGEEFNDVNMRIEPVVADGYWELDLSGETLAGLVKIPFAEDEYLDLDLEYLRLAGSEEDRMGPQQQQDYSEELEAIDTLIDIDPRELPKMKFATNEFRIGDRSFGSWQFRLDPVAGGADFNDLVFDFRGLRLGIEGTEEAQQLNLPAHFSWHYDGTEHHSELSGILYADDIAEVLTANGYAASLESDNAVFIADIDWPGSPAFFSASKLSGAIELEIEDGRFLQGGAGAAGALKLISILNFDAIMRRLRFSDDLLRSGLAYEDISAELILNDGHVDIKDRMVITGPSSLYQITGELDLAEETILGEMYLTLPVSENIPWLGLLTANIPLAVGAYLFDRIFGSQVNSLTSAVYTLDGPWEGLEPEFKQAFGSPDSPSTDLPL